VNFVLVWAIIVAVLILDISLSRISTLLYGELSSFSINYIIFIVIVGVSIIGQYFILQFVKDGINKIGIIEEKLHINTLYKIVKIAQFVLFGLLIYTALEIAMTKNYHTIIITIVTTVSFVLAIGMLVLFTRQFFSWFATNKGYVLLSYGISSSSLIVNSAFSLALVGLVSINMPFTTGQHAQSFYLVTVPGSITSIIDSGYVISSIASFIITWFATALLLYHYSRRVGRIIYWVVLSLPLVYFLSQFVSFFIDLANPLLQSDPFFYGIFFTLIFTISKPAGGMLFGLAFWTIARKIDRRIIVRNYMLMSAYGFVLLFVSNQAVALTILPYPPFGLTTVSTMGLSSFLLLIGIYSSAISVSQDINLRKAVKKFSFEESRLLDSISSAHMEEELQSRMIAMIRKNQDAMKEETGLESSLNENDMKQYLSQVLEEIKRQKGDS
jgi:hypothetical protein